MDEFEKMIAEIRKEKALENRTYWGFGTFNKLHEEDLRQVVRDALKKPVDCAPPEGIPPAVIDLRIPKLSDELLEKLKQQMRCAAIMPCGFEAPSAVWVRTADDMFRDLGYRVRNVPECIERTTARIYIRDETEDYIEVHYNGWVTARHKNEIRGLSREEIAACAKLNEELSGHS